MDPFLQAAVSGVLVGGLMFVQLLLFIRFVLIPRLTKQIVERLVPTVDAEAPCKDCSQKEAMETRAKEARVQPGGRRVVLMTVFDAWESSYSLTTVVTEQALSLAAKGYYVEVWVSSKLSNPPIIPGVRIVPCMPEGPWKVGNVDKKRVKAIVDTIKTNLMVVGTAKIITHDLLFIPHYLPVTLALHEIGDMPGMQFWHQVHSIPNPFEESPQAHHPLRHQMPGTAKGHRLLVMSNEAKPQVAVWFNAAPERVDVLRNSRDFYRWNHFTPTAKTLATHHGLLQSDLVLVYPYSQPRYIAKGVPALISLAECLHRHTPSGVRILRLVLPNAHVMSDKDIEDVEELMQTAVDCGLTRQQVIFTSQSMPALRRSGLDVEDVRSLFTLSPLFIMPTRIDHYSLITLEAAMSGCQLCLNEDRPFLKEMFPSDQNIIWHSFGNMMKPGKLDEMALSELAKRLWDRVLTAAPHSKTSRRSFHSEIEFGRDLATVLMRP